MASFRALVTWYVRMAHKIGFHSLFGLTSTVESSHFVSKYFEQACMKQLTFLWLALVCWPWPNIVRRWTFAGTSTSRLVIGRPTEPMLQNHTAVISWSRSPITASESWRWTELQRTATCNSSSERRIGQQGISKNYKLLSEAHIWLISSIFLQRQIWIMV